MVLASEFDRLNRDDGLARLPLGTVEIIVAGKVVPKGRARSFVHKVSHKLVVTTPPETRRYEDLIRSEAARVMEHRRQLDGMLAVDIRVFVLPPQAIAKHKIKGPSAEAGVIRPITKPDWDNYGKVCDALNGIVWRDDCLIVDGRVQKFYSIRPRLEMRAWEL